MVSRNFVLVGHVVDTGADIDDRPEGRVVRNALHTFAGDVDLAVITQ